MKQRDWATLYDSCSPQSRSVFTFLTVLGAEMNAIQDKAKKANLNQLYRQHGLDPGKKLATDFRTDPHRAANELLSGVNDQRVFFSDVMDWCSNNSKRDAVSELVGRLESVKIDGATATGTVVQKNEKKKAVTKDIKFSNVGGLWYLHFSWN